MSNKIVIAKPGFNALTETDPDNLIFSSDYNTLKYDTLTSTSVTVDFTQYYHSEFSGLDTIYYHRKVVTIAHGLSYIPFFVGYFLDYPASGQDVQLPIYAADFLSFATLQCYADETNIYFVYYSGLAGTNSGSTTYNVKYRIFKNRTNL